MPCSHFYAAKFFTVIQNIRLVWSILVFLEQTFLAKSILDILNNVQKSNQHYNNVHKIRGVGRDTHKLDFSMKKTSCFLPIHNQCGFQKWNQRNDCILKNRVFRLHSVFFGIPLSDNLRNSSIRKIRISRFSSTSLLMTLI